MVDVKKIMEIQQSPLYASYITSLGWHVEYVGGSQLFVKQFPLYGGFAKLQRTTHLPTTRELKPLFSKYHVKKLSVEPDARVPQKKFSQWFAKISPHVSLVATPYIPTKTIRVDCTPSEQQIFEQFTEAKRRAVRKAQKNNVQIQESTNIQDLIKIKNKSAGFLGFITTTGINKIWPIFAPNHAAILLAYRDKGQATRDKKDCVGGVLVLFWDKIAYYWIAGATREGKKLFAPTLLVWEAIKLAKKQGARQFDFVGVWDERIPKENKAWLGFTKFKEGFGGKSLYYPINR